MTGQRRLDEVPEPGPGVDGPGAPPSGEPVVRARRKLGDVLFLDLKAQMTDGRLPPDVRLPSEHDLSQQFGVSRPVVREALHRLRTAGFIHSRQGSGSYVRERTPGPIAPSGAAVQGEPNEPTGGMATVADVRRVFEFRFILEGGAAYAAAQNRSEADLEAIGTRLAALDRAVEQGLLGVQEDLDLHRAIAAGTQNRFVERAFAAMAAEVRAVIDISRTRVVEYRAKMQREHHLIVGHIRDGNPSAARDGMQSHIRDAQERLFAEISV